MLQIVFHARVAEENGYFTMQDVVNDITAKMVISTSACVSKCRPRNSRRYISKLGKNWKAKEKGHERNIYFGWNFSRITSFITGSKNYKRKQVKWGSDWPSEEGVWAKFYEEIDEFKQEIFKKEYRKSGRRGGEMYFFP